ncbi:MAG: FkbM family methyltransferase [Xanthobacteraceae bacterium]
MSTIPAIPHRRPFLEKLNTSWRKRRLGPKPSSGREVRCSYFGAQLDVNLNDEVGYEIAINRFEWRELKMMIEACKRFKPDIFVDVGANLGLYTCVVGRLGTVPRLVAFEPDRENFARLKANLALNDLTEKVEAHEAAVGAQFGTATLVPSAQANRGMSRIGGKRADDAYEVALVTLDDIVPQVGRNIAIKIDVEGFEEQVLSGASRLFSRNGGYAQIEAHGDEAAARLIARMEGFGWRFRDRYGLDVRFEKP